MNRILIGNLIAFAGAVIMVLIGLIRSKRNILIAQCVQFAVMGIGNLVLGGVTGFVSNIVSIARNIVCFYRPLTVPLKLLFIVILGGIGLYTNNLGLVGLCPVISAVLFTWYLDSDEIRLKIVIIITSALWTCFDFTIHNYVTMVMDLLTIVTNTAGIVMIRSGKAGRRRSGRGQDPA